MLPGEYGLGGWSTWRGESHGSEIHAGDGERGGGRETGSRSHASAPGVSGWGSGELSWGAFRDTGCAAAVEGWRGVRSVGRGFGCAVSEEFRKIRRRGVEVSGSCSRGSVRRFSFLVSRFS